jgi:hypothetical protein
MIPCLVKNRRKSMTAEEFSNQFDVLSNNITSNQSPGLNEYEKSVFLTKAQNEIVKNYFTANSKGNNIGQGFDDSAKRQADFSCLMKTWTTTSPSSLPSGCEKIDPRSTIYTYPSDVFIIINEALASNTTTNSLNVYQVIPLRYDEYTRLMSKPYKRPLKNQAWRLINYGSDSTKYAELVAGPNVTFNSSNYRVRYIRFPKPIIVGNLDGLTIDGETAVQTPACELDPIIHEDILQRAVELAKIAWTATGQDNAQMVLQTGQRSE